MKKELFQACIFNSANLEVSGTEMFDFRRKSLERGGSYGSSPFVDVIEHANALMSGVTARNHTCEKIYLFYWYTIALFRRVLFQKAQVPIIVIFSCAFHHIFDFVSLDWSGGSGLTPARYYIYRQKNSMVAKN